VDADRIGVIGISLGGYYAPRAAAFERRLKCCIAWGALWDLSAVLGHMTDADTRSVQLGTHVPWALGETDPDALREKIARFRLEDVIERVECPLLVSHGENDRQVPLWQAQRTYEGAVNARRRDLRVFTVEEGGSEHVHLDNMSVGVHAMADWAADVLRSGATD
jgi:dipeptidyl aminopeptidase/acylaminoacyl peptidase